jgi:hypothetical protein
MHVQTQLAPQLQAERKRRRRWLALAVVLAVAGVVLALQFKELYGSVKGWRARRLVLKVEEGIVAEKWQEAMNNAQAAYQLQPDEPLAIRAAARLHGLTGHPERAIGFWKLLLASEHSVPADRVAYAGDLLKVGAVADAGREIDDLMRTQPDDAATLRLAAQRAMADGNPNGAREFAVRAQQRDPENHEGRLLLGLLQLGSGNPALVNAGLRGLQSLGRERSNEALEALRRLAMQQGLKDEAAREIVELLNAHPAGIEDDRLLALGLDIARRPEERAALLDAAVERYKTADGAARRSFGAWLNSMGDHRRTTLVIPADEALKRKDLLLVYLDAIAALKRWEEVRRILEIKNVPLDGAYRELFLARSALELGEATRADLHLRRARVLAGPSSEQMGFIANYSEKVGQLEHAEIAYRSLTANANTARPAYEALLRIAQRRQDMDMLRDVLGEMSRRWPKDSAVANDYAYFSLLQGRDVKASLAKARELVAQSPTSLAHRTTLALAGLRLKDPAVAMSAYQGARIPWDRVPASQRAVHAAVLGLSGKTEEARAEANGVRLEDIRIEERELIKPWRTP